MSKNITKVKWLSSSRELWLKQRAEILGQGSTDIVRFGSSEVATVLNCGFDSKLRMFYNKIGQHVTQKKSYKMSMGSALEPLIASSFESWNGDRDQFDEDFSDGIKHRKVKQAKYFILNSKYPHLVASLDYVIPKKYPCIFTGEYPKTDIILECKNPAYLGYRDWRYKPKGIPEYYDIQIQQQLMVSELSKACLGLIAGSDYFDAIEVIPDIEFQRHIDYEVRLFAGDILKAKTIQKAIDDELASKNPDQSFIDELKGMIHDLEPDVTNSESDTEFLDDYLYPTSNGLTLQGDMEDDSLMEGYLDCNEKISELTKLKQLNRNRLIEKMQSWEILETGAFKCVNRKGSAAKKDYFSVTKIREKK